MIDLDSKIYVAGHAGMAGSAICRLLKKKGYTNVIGKTHKELDLARQADVENFIKEEKPELIILAAAKVGGMTANMNDQCSFLMDNVIIEHNVIRTAFENDVENLIFFGSSCIYPKSEQAIKEESLLKAAFDPTHEGYVIAKLVGFKACQYYNEQYGTNYLGVVPPNLYGINDNYDLETAPVVPALIRKMHEAKVNNDSQVEIWGTGNQYRELLFSDDMADAILFAFEHFKGSLINIGTGKDNTIREISTIIKNIVGFEGELYFDTSKPDGVHRRLLDTSKLNNLGWEPKHTLEEGLKISYDWYLNHMK